MWTEAKQFLDPIYYPSRKHYNGGQKVPQNIVQTYILQNIFFFEVFFSMVG